MIVTYLVIVKRLIMIAIFLAYGSGLRDIIKT
jgi:hypothetical protein